MLRNLLYSLSLHLFVFLLLYSDTILYGTERTLDLAAGQKRDMEIDKLYKIKNHLFDGNKLRTLTLKQKIDLYENYDKIKSIKTAKYNEIKNRLKDNMVFSTKENINKEAKMVQNDNAVDANVINKNNYNIVTKEHHNIYVDESKLTKEQIKKIDEQNKLKEKIREQIKTDTDNRNVQARKEDDSEQMSLDELLDNLDKSLIVVNDKTKQDFTVVDTKNKNASTDLKEIADLMKIDDIDKLIEAKDNITNNDVYTIFTKEDYNIMSQTKSSIYELSFRERSNIQKQIMTCYKNAILKTRKNSSIVMSARIKLDKNGQIDINDITFEIEEEQNIKDIDKNEYFTTIENIKLALVYCNPLRGLPNYKYNIWKNMNLIFNN